MMIDLSSERLFEEMIKRANRMRGDEQPHGFALLVDSTVAMEKALAGLTRCQALQTKTCLFLLMNQTAPIPAMLLANWLEVSNRWLEAMAMFHWVEITRLKRVLPYWLMRGHSKKNERIPSAILEAQLLTVSASGSLAEAQIQLLDQIIRNLQQSPSNAQRLDKLEKEALLILDSIGEMLRILVRKHDPFMTFDNEKAEKIGSSVQEISASLLSSMKKLESQAALSPLFSREFIYKLRESLKRLIEHYSSSKNFAPMIFHSDSPLPKPWLNEEVFGPFSKRNSRK
ncbi:hypothetical protein AN963_15500 [Brevibacillus choshinensis]|uniref:Uncharacterized protein n=2 Tax=Brevibacillus choshinensis TaxID=54911 RepID=A0ABR5N6W5_BRECH|nr:hypothetical protein AN963_15500 [Brevibacillus choshinensis]